MPGLTISQVIDDPHLFGPLFASDTWRRWRVFLRALFGEPITGEALEIFRHHTERTDPPGTLSREAALICGRRGGKSRILALIAVFLAAFRDYTPYLSPGEQGVVAIIASDRKQAKVLLRYCVGLLRSVQLLARLVESEFAESVMLTNGITIEIHTGSISSPRGRTYIGVLADEIAFWRSEESSNPDAEVIQAVRPGLASIPNSMLLMASSPYAKRGVLWQTFRKYFGHNDAKVLVWRGSTEEMNPRIDPAFIAEEREKDPASASAEYDANFRDDIAAFISRETIDACTTPGRSELLPAAGITYRAFVDPSGGSSDSMTLAISHAQRDIAVLDAVREIRPPFSPEAVVQEFAALLKTYHVHEVVGDRYAGEWPRERFQAHRITYKLSDAPKSDLYRDTLPLLNSRKVELLDLPRLMSQFCGLERRTTRGGRDSIDHAPGAHDDIANSVAGALLLVGHKKPLVFSDEVLAALSVRHGSPVGSKWRQPST